MSQSIKAVVILGLFVAVAACQQEEDVILVEPQPIMAEPATTKY